MLALLLDAAFLCAGLVMNPAAVRSVKPHPRLDDLGRSAPIRMLLPAYVPTERVAEISEPAAVNAINGMQYVSLALPADCATSPVDVAYIRTSVTPQPSQPPVLLIHGFDISCLEYRRLLPLLEAEGVEAYAPCVLGWGFTDTSNARSVGFEAKRAQLLAFWREVLGGRPMVVVAASLGASIAVDLFADTPEAFASLVMLDPATYTDPPPPVPEFAAKLLIDNVIGAPQVRESIAKQAYFNKPLQTEDAIRVGNLHVLRPQWSRDSVEWLLLGGYDVRESMPSLAVIPCLTLWGRDTRSSRRRRWCRS